MKLNTKETLKQMNGDPVLEVNEKQEAVPVLVRDAIVNALLAPVQNDKGTEKIKKYELATKVYKNEEVDLDEKEIALIKERVGESYAPLVVGQIYEMLKV